MQMEAGLSQRKSIELEHLQQQFKLYRQNYQGRPLHPQHAPTFLHQAAYLANLTPTIATHYATLLSSSESHLLATLSQTLLEDLLTKIRLLAQRTERRETTDQKRHDSLCRGCLTSLRQAEINQISTALQSKSGVSSNLLRMIRQVEEEGGAFAGQNDKHFFEQLSAALEKKREVLQICNTEGQEYAKMVETQLEELMAAKEQFLMERMPREEHNAKGADLQGAVMASLKSNFSLKLPQLISHLADTLRKTAERKRKLHSSQTSTQTVDADSLKLMQLRRKLTVAESALASAVAEREKIGWALQEKQMMVGRLQKEMRAMREDCDKKIYEAQKETRQIEDKRRKEVQKMVISKQEFEGEGQKTFKNLHKDNEQEEEKMEVQQEEANEERRSRKKKTFNTTSKSSSKFFLPTLSKIRGSEQMSAIADQETTVQPEYYIAENLDPISPGQSQQQTPALQQSSISQPKVKKDVKRMMTMADQQNSNQKERKITLKSLKTERDINKATAPLVKDRYKERFTHNEKARVSQKDSSAVIKTLPQARTSKQKLEQILKKSTSINIQTSPVQNQVKQMKEQAREISAILREKAVERSSFSSSVSSKVKEPLKNKSIFRRGQEHISPEGDSFLVTTPTSNNRKPYILNSFSRINEEIEKQNFQTPLQGKESPLPKNMPQWQRMLQKIYHQLIDTQTQRQTSLQDFSKLFLKCLQLAKSQGNSARGSVGRVEEGQFVAIVSNGQKQENRMSKQRHKKEMKLLKSRLQKHLESRISPSLSKDYSFEGSKTYHFDKRKGTDIEQTPFSDLFLTSQAAYLYEASYSKKAALPLVLPSPSLQQYTLELFADLEKLRSRRSPHYQELCSYLRFPFAHSQQGNLQIDIIQTLSLGSLQHSFMRIATLHRGCGKEEGLCEHLNAFRGRVAQLAH